MSDVSIQQRIDRSGFDVAIICVYQSSPMPSKCCLMSSGKKMNIITAKLLVIPIHASWVASAKVLRWRILAQKPHCIQEVDLILGIGNLFNVVVLGWESVCKPWTLLFCVTWVSRRFSKPFPVMPSLMCQSPCNGLHGTAEKWSQSSF
jgi:hypothetical protein